MASLWRHKDPLLRVSSSNSSSSWGSLALCTYRFRDSYNRAWSQRFWLASSWVLRLFKPIFFSLLLRLNFFFLLSGPTFLGKIPGFTDTFFPPRSVPFLASLAQFGMVMYMFMVGISLSVEQIIEYKKITLGAFIVGNGLPFVAAIGLSFLFDSRYSSGSRSLSLLPLPYHNFL
jgi:hypothetical protein